MRTIALIAAHNEEQDIEETLRALLAQTYKLDAIVVAADNCVDNTVAIASSVPGVTVFEAEGNAHRKVGALTMAYHRYVVGHEYDLVVFIDADTILADHSVADWVAEFEANPKLGGCSSRFTMLPQDDMSRWGRFLTRLQKYEFAVWTTTAFRRGRHTTVLAGTACAIRTTALAQAAALPDRPGPWSFESQVEDMEITYQLRKMGWEIKVSATVRAYTDSMTTMRALWGQRCKWQEGTVIDLLRFGVNRWTLRDWSQQALGLMAAFVRVSWVTFMTIGFLSGSLVLTPIWFLPAVVFAMNDVKNSMRVPHRTPMDVIQAALLFPQEFFAWTRAAWFTVSWVRVLTGRTRDGWAIQSKAEETRRDTVGRAHGKEVKDARIAS